MAWLSKVFTYCLEMWVGKGSINEALGRIETMQAEIERLRNIQREATIAEAHSSALRRDLCMEVGVDNSVHAAEDLRGPRDDNVDPPLSQVHSHTMGPNDATHLSASTPSGSKNDSVVLPTNVIEKTDRSIPAFSAPSLTPPHLHLVPAMYLILVTACLVLLLVIL